MFIRNLREDGDQMSIFEEISQDLIMGNAADVKKHILSAIEQGYKAEHLLQDALLPGMDAIEAAQYAADVYDADRMHIENE